MSIFIFLAFILFRKIVLFYISTFPNIVMNTKQSGCGTGSKSTNITPYICTWNNIVNSSHLFIKYKNFIPSLESLWDKSSSQSAETLIGSWKAWTCIFLVSSILCNTFLLSPAALAPGPRCETDCSHNTSLFSICLFCMIVTNISTTLLLIL